MQDHIVLLSPGFPESESDSTTIPAIQDFLKCLKQQMPNTKLSLIAFQYPFTTEVYKWNGINIYPLNGKNLKSRKLLVWSKALSLLFKLNKEDQIKAIHSFWIGECSFIGSIFCNLKKVNHIITLMGQDARSKNVFYYLSTLKNAKLVSLSNFQNNIFKKIYKMRSEIIPWFILNEDKPILSDSEIDVLGVGSLNEVKNYKLFIEIISDVVKIIPKLKVEIIGDGELSSEISDQIRALDLQDNISLKGSLSRDLVFDKMSRSKILLHTSGYESFGMIYLEALFHGMKIVSSNVGIADQSDYCKICNNKAEFAEAIINYHRSEYMKRSVVLFDGKETINKYISLYNA